MAKASIVAARQAQAVAEQAEQLAAITERLEQIEQKLHLLLEVLEKGLVKAAEAKQAKGVK